MGKFEKGNELAILTAGRRPDWQLQESYTGIPASASAGVALNDAVITYPVVAARTEAHRRKAVVTVGTLDLTATYTVTIDGTDVDYDAAADTAADEADVLAGIVAAITADATVNLIVTAVVSGETVIIRGIGQDHYSIDISATGSAVLECVADPDSGSIIVWTWMREQGSNSPSWWVSPNGSDYTLAARGFVERFETAGVDRMYVQVFNLDGTGDGAEVDYAVVVRIGPSVTE